MVYSIVNKLTGTTISNQAKIADNFILRLRGLMFQKEIESGQALIFPKAPAIHTCFMRFPIDIVFLDKQNKVIKIFEAVRPWRMVYCPHSALVIELPAQRAAQRSLKLGDSLEIVDSD